ncbi:MAG TPA: 3-ketoacyl-ACP reductase [bacterium]|nr:3-ketoacyl-ACP reductase [bacterium]
MNPNQPVALITGAARGIGRSIALNLAEAGYAIVANDLSFPPSGGNESGLRREVEDRNSRFHPVELDISDLDRHDRLIRESLDAFGRIDFLVNNAGIAPARRLDILETTPESYDRLMEVNARGPFFLSQRVGRLMIRQKASLGSDYRPGIVFITSISAAVSSPSRAEYCVSKAALSHAAALFAHRLAEHGIGVYEIRPGIIRTAMTEPVRKKYDRLIEEGLVPQNRWGCPEDIGKAVASLARGDFAFATGSVFEISGGMQMRRLE